MGTRSRIGVMHGNLCKSVYCHWDGYLEHNGVILQEHYDSAKANHLVSLGDLSALRPEIGDQHAFSQFEIDDMDRDDFIRTTQNMCTFYGRDRLETGVDFKVAQDFKEFLAQVEHCYSWICGRCTCHLLKCLFTLFIICSVSLQCFVAFVE